LERVYKHYYFIIRGAVLNTLCYKESERISGDTDIMVNSNDLNKCSELLQSIGYKQGEVENGNFVPATKKQIIFARLNTYETVPFVKPMKNETLPFHEGDINFRLSNDDSIESALEMLNDTIRIETENGGIRTLNIEKFLIFLCIHHYREATMVFKIVAGEDMILYKYMDIHMFLSKNEINLEEIVRITNKIGRKKEVYHTLYYTELLYPNTVDKRVFEMLDIAELSFLNQYRGRDNSDELYEWKTSFYSRCFSNERRIEAMKNIKGENERFNSIKDKLKG